MGLDLALGVIILVAAFRGWFQGFILQAIRLVALVAAVYSAVRVRDYAKPYAATYLSTIQPDLVDRLLWWVSAVVTYLVLVGVARLVVKMTRRPAIPGIPQSDRNDQFAGFVVGGVKGVVVAIFATAAIQNYGLEQVKSITWTRDQAEASWALKWNESYQPAGKIWASRPVRHFVTYVQRMGLHRPGDSPDASSGDLGDDSLLRTASRPTEAEATAGDQTSEDPAAAPRSSTSASAPPAEAPDTSEKESARSKSNPKRAADDAN
jgi:uncharacterized membrane protein required for colicin V production